MRCTSGEALKSRPSSAIPTRIDRCNECALCDYGRCLWAAVCPDARAREQIDVTGSGAEQAEVRAALPGPRTVPQADGTSAANCVGVALAAVGFAPPGPKAPLSLTEGMRGSMPVGKAPGARISFLRAGDPPALVWCWCMGRPARPPVGRLLDGERRQQAPMSSPWIGRFWCQRPGRSTEASQRRLRLSWRCCRRTAARSCCWGTRWARRSSWAAAQLAAEQPERSVAIVMLAGRWTLAGTKSTSCSRLVPGRLCSVCCPASSG